MSASVILFRNARILDGRADTPLDDHDVLVEGNAITQVTGERLSSSGNPAYTSATDLLSLTNFTFFTFTFAGPTESSKVIAPCF